MAKVCRKKPNWRHPIWKNGERTLDGYCALPLPRKPKTCAVPLSMHDQGYARAKQLYELSKANTHTQRSNDALTLLQETQGLKLCNLADYHCGVIDFVYDATHNQMKKD